MTPRLIKRLLQNDGTILFISTIIVNAGNYLINLLLGRFLGPVEFAEISVLATAVLMLSFFAVGLQLTAAKFTAEYLSVDEELKFSSFIKWLNKYSWYISLTVAAIIILASFQLMSFFHFRNPWSFMVIAIAIPLYFDFSISRGVLQGTDSFKKLANTYLIEMFVRMVITATLVYVSVRYGGIDSTMAVALGFTAAFIATYWYARREPQRETNTELLAMKPIKAFIVVIIFYELSQIMINNSDILLVKHFFENEEAGLYGALALIGRVVFFATWTIVTLLFPKVIQKEKKGEPHSHLFWGALSIVGVIGLMIIVGCYLLGDFVITVLFGNEFISAGQYLWLYACATTLFACANVFAYYYMSLSKYMPVIFSIIAGACQIGLIWFFHKDITQVITVQIYLMATLFMSMVVYHFYNSMFQGSSSMKAIVNGTDSMNTIKTDLRSTQ